MCNRNAPFRIKLLVHPCQSCPSAFLLLFLWLHFLWKLRSHMSDMFIGHVSCFHVFREAVMLQFKLCKYMLCMLWLYTLTFMCQNCFLYIAIFVTWTARPFVRTSATILENCSFVRTSHTHMTQSLNSHLKDWTPNIWHFVT